MQAKPKSSLATCKRGQEYGPAELQKLKSLFCKGYKHLDLSSSNIRSIAMYYVKHDVSPSIINDNQKMNSLASSLRYDVDDTSCPSKLFEAKDISIQHIAMNRNGSVKEWVAVVNLNTQDKNGYLKSELPFCEDRNYLIDATVKVKAYTDYTKCCKQLKDYNKCQCKDKMVALKTKSNKGYSKDVILRGTSYEVCGEEGCQYSKRRRLLQKSGGNS
jgi:hypothetical protein